MGGCHALKRCLLAKLVPKLNYIPPTLAQSAQPAVKTCSQFLPGQDSI